MCYSDEMLQWYVLQVRPKYEETVSILLRYKGYEGYVPSYRTASQHTKASSVSTIKLFPGYVFCRFKYGEAGQLSDGHGVVTTPWVIKVLGGRKPIPVLPQEITAIQRALASRLTPKPWPFLQTGQKVEIGAGPFRGISGTIVCAKGTHYLVLSVEILQRSVAITIDKAWLNPTIAVREALDTARSSLG